MFLACFRQYKLASGERGVVMLLSADKKQAKQVRRYLGAFINETPMLAAMVVRETTESIRAQQPSTVEVNVAS